MEQSILDPEWQRIHAIKSLFDSPGWKIFEEEINARLECAKVDVENLSSTFLKKEQLEEYNFNLARVKCFKSILDIKEELLDNQNSPAQESDGEQNTSEMS